MIVLLFPKGGQWEREEVQNHEVVHTESQMHTFHFGINLSLERKMAVSCISAWNYPRNLLFQIGPIYCCQCSCMALRIVKTVTSFTMKTNAHIVFQ